MQLDLRKRSMIIWVNRFTHRFTSVGCIRKVEIMVSVYKIEKSYGKPVRLICDSEYAFEDSVRTPRKVYSLMRKMGVLKDTEERLYLLSLSTAGDVKGVFEVAHGTVSSTLLNERGIAQRLLLSDAAEFITVHNHPSGSVEPSLDDCLCSRRLKRVSEVIGINYIDNIIVGNGYFSFNERGMLR